MVNNRALADFKTPSLTISSLPPLHSLAQRATKIFNSIKLNYLLREAAVGKALFDENTLANFTGASSPITNSSVPDYSRLETFGWEPLESDQGVGIEWNHNGVAVRARYDYPGGWELQHGNDRIAVSEESPFCAFLTDRYQHVCYRRFCNDSGYSGAGPRDRFDYYAQYLKLVEESSLSPQSADPKMTQRLCGMIHDTMDAVRTRISGIPAPVYTLFAGATYFKLHINTPEKAESPPFGVWITVSDHSTYEASRYYLTIDYGPEIHALPKIHFLDRHDVGGIELPQRSRSQILSQIPDDLLSKVDALRKEKNISEGRLDHPNLSSVGTGLTKAA